MALPAPNGDSQPSKWPPPPLESGSRREAPARLSVPRSKRSSRLDERLGRMAVALALHSEGDPASVAPELAQKAGDNRTAVRRALARLHANNPRGLGPVGKRAAEILRQAGAILGRDRHGARRQPVADLSSSDARAATRPR